MQEFILTYNILWFNFNGIARMVIFCGNKDSIKHAIFFFLKFGNGHNKSRMMLVGAIGQ